MRSTPTLRFVVHRQTCPHNRRTIPRQARLAKSSRTFRPSINLVFLFCLSLGAAFTSAQPLVAGMEKHPLVHSGYSRPYLLYKPAHLPPHPAVVFMLGGIHTSALATSRNFGWTEEADLNGFIAVFPEAVATRPDRPADPHTNITFWEMEGSRTHLPAPGMMPVDDDGYLLSVLDQVIQQQKADRHRIFFAGFSSGSGMAQLFAAHHPEKITAIAAVATPLMHPPPGLARPVAVLYIHGDEDEQFSGFEVNSPLFATTPHGNWVTWGYLDGCRVQTAQKTDWGVELSWKDCKGHVPVVADFVAHLGHEWAGSLDSDWNKKHLLDDPLQFTDMAWKFFASLHSR